MKYKKCELIKMEFNNPNLKKSILVRTLQKYIYINYKKKYIK